tara:strand:+ start:73 stop:474 length:402 start_codon:yes stop_codon:yes gene_type:complete
MKNLAFTAIICLLTFSFSCAQNSYETEIKNIANDTNRELPAMVDSETRFESVSPKSGKIYQYNYTLINVVKSNFNAESFSKNQKLTILNGIKKMRNNSGFKFFIENNVTFAYNYNDKNGENLLKFFITPSDYK